MSSSLLLALFTLPDYSDGYMEGFYITTITTADNVLLLISFHFGPPLHTNTNLNQSINYYAVPPYDQQVFSAEK